LEDDVDVEKQRFPYSIVWTPLPPLNWILPFVGHMGIADSKGIIYDFAGPYTIGVDEFAFGKVAKYWRLDPKKISNKQLSEQVDSDGEKENEEKYAELWDKAIHSGSNEYEKQMHCLVWNNCHSHVARCLNIMKYNNFWYYNVILLLLLFTVKCKYVSFGRMAISYIGFFLVLIFALLIHFLT